jgi:hypothetical protein
MSEAAKALKELSNMFAHTDWTYTRNNQVSDIRYRKDFETTNSFQSRIKRSARWLFGQNNSWASGLEQTFLGRLRLGIVMSFFSLRRTHNTPDGLLADGSIITFWEEDGVYINLMQPSVGNLLADFLEAEPDNPHAKAMSKEIARILDQIKEDS